MRDGGPGLEDARSGNHVVREACWHLSLSHRVGYETDVYTVPTFHFSYMHSGRQIQGLMCGGVLVSEVLRFEGCE